LDDGIFFVSLGPRILILKSIGGQIIHNFHCLLKDEEAINWKEGFQSFHWSRGTSSRKAMEAYQGRKEYVLLMEKEREENECVRKILILMCGRVLFIKKMCARNKHGRISMTKPLEFCFK
jgi:hypothetical protein